MALTSEPDAGIPLPKKRGKSYEAVGPGLEDFSDRIAAATKTVEILARNGLNVNPEDVDLGPVESLVMSYATVPEDTNKAATVTRLGRLTPAQLVFTNKLLDEWGHKVVESASQVRHLVMNRLLHETDNEDPRIRIRALELLGKVTEVGLFSERVEVTHTHQTADDLREKLREKLQKIVVVAEPEDAIEVSPSSISVDSLGKDDD